MEDVDKEPEEWKTTWQDLMFFVKNCEGNNTGAVHDINSREQQENNARTNQQEQQAPQHVKYDNGAAQQQQNQYEAGKTDTGTHAADTGMMYMPSIRELGYWNQTSLLSKDFKIRGVNDRLSFVSLSHQINDGGTAGYSEKEIMAGDIYHVKLGRALWRAFQLKSRSQTGIQGNIKERLVTFVKRYASNCTKIRLQ